MAFTLPELLVVIGIIALLAAILTPTMSQAIQVAHDRLCKDHLYRLGQAVQRAGMGTGGTAASPFSLPPSSGWVGAAYDLGKDLLMCPKDDGTSGCAGTDTVANYYILQLGGDGKYLISDLGAALGVGSGVLQDVQLTIYKGPNYVPVAHVPGRHPCMCKVPALLSNQVAACVCSEAIVIVTTGPGEMVTFESVIGCTAGPGTTASDHWLMKGHSTNGGTALNTDTTVMQLGGQHCIKVAPSFAFNVEKCSYGMNLLVNGGSLHTDPGRIVSPQQIMLMDANSGEVRVGEAGWSDHVADRHFGRTSSGKTVGMVNYVTAGGMVRSTTKTDLASEYARYQTKGGDMSGSLLGRQAAPLMKE